MVAFSEYTKLVESDKSVTLQQNLSLSRAVRSFRPTRVLYTWPFPRERAAGLSGIIIHYDNNDDNISTTTYFSLQGTIHTPTESQSCLECVQYSSVSTHC